MAGNGEGQPLTPGGGGVPWSLAVGGRASLGKDRAGRHDVVYRSPLSVRTDCFVENTGTEGVGFFMYISPAMLVKGSGRKMGSSGFWIGGVV